MTEDEFHEKRSIPTIPESHVVSIQTASQQEIVGLIRQPIESQFLTVLNACFIMRESNKIHAMLASKSDQFLSKNITVNTSGAFIVELHPDSKLFKLWQQANSSILMPQPNVRLAGARTH